MEVGRPPGGCKVMKAVSRPPVFKTCRLSHLDVCKLIKVFSSIPPKKPDNILYLRGVRWAGLGGGVVVG